MNPILLNCTGFLDIVLKIYQILFFLNNLKWYTITVLFFRCLSSKNMTCDQFPIYKQNSYPPCLLEVLSFIARNKNFEDKAILLSHCTSNLGSK